MGFWAKCLEQSNFGTKVVRLIWNAMSWHLSLGLTNASLAAGESANKKVLVLRIEQSTLFWQPPQKTFHPDLYQTVNPHQVWSPAWCWCSAPGAKHQSAVQLWRHMVPTDTFTLCRVKASTRAHPFQFDQYQSLKWLSEQIKTHENQKKHCRAWFRCRF